MATQHSIPRKDADFNIAQNIIASTASSKRNEWLLDSVWLDNDLLPKKALWESAFAAYENPQTRTPTITFAKTEKRKEYEPLLRKLVKVLQSNPRVSADDLRSMGIVVPTPSHTPAPVARRAPDMDFDTSVPRRVGVFFFDQESNHRRGKPDGQHGVEIVWSILDAPPASYAELVHSAFDTHSPYVFEFDLPNSGKRLYLALRWENTRGEKGPWSDVQSVVIP